ncbi:MAG: hypothetical protein ACAH95_12780 [Fimbriimonas sp.]
MSRHLTAISALLPLASLAGAQLSMNVQQTIEGYSPGAGPIPVTIEFENTGPSASGILRVLGQGFRTDYAIEVPQGGRKQLIAYPQTDYGDINFTLLTNVGRINQRMSPETKWQPGQQVMLVFSDSSGDLAFVRNKGNAPNNALSVQDAYCKPGKGPDRPVGYSGISAVVLGSGSERLTDREVDALKLWTLSGGTLVFLGGASAPILNDTRWSEVLPAKRFRTVNIGTSAVLGKMGATRTPAMTLTTGEPIEAANAAWDGGNLLTAERQMGVGRVIYMSFNLLEEPLSKWEGRRAALFKIVRPAELNGRRMFVTNYARETQGTTFASVSPSGIPGGPPRSTRSDPFSTKLPPAGDIFLVLGIYFLAVIPLNFIVLKKLNRGELAWFTAPILSLGFAGLLFTRAQDLYAAQMSSASQGLLVAQEGMPEGIFIGSSQVFIPRGGSYDLKLEGVDSVGVVENQDGYYYGGYRRGAESSTMELNPLDDGEIHVPALRANNLTFREINYRQREPAAGDWFKIRQIQRGKLFEVVNNSPYTLEKAVICVGKRAFPITGTLAPGQKLKVSAGKDSTEAWEQGPSFAGIMTSKTLGLSGKLKGLRPGPQIGKEVAARTEIRYVFISREAAE